MVKLEYILGENERGNVIMPEMTPELRATFLGLLMISVIFAFVNYLVTGYAIYSVSKVEKVDKPWLGWIPIGNFYQLIKLGKGNYAFIVALVGIVLFKGMNGMIPSLIAIVSSVIYTIYSMYMYYKICDRYDISFLFIAIGSLSIVCILIKSIGGFLIPVLLIGLYGQWNLARKIKKAKNPNERRIKTEVIGMRKRK